MRDIVKVFNLVFAFVCICYQTDGFRNQVSNHYEDLKKNHHKIFPDKNRNSGGAQFYHYIINNLKPSYEDFLEYNKCYCSVSGSLVNPNNPRSQKSIVMKDINENLVYGTQYKCCDPCICDITLARVEKHNYDGHTIHVLVLKDPCQSPENIPDQVSSFKCNSGKTQNAEYTDSGHLIIGLLHDAKPYDPKNPLEVKHRKEHRDYCEERQQLPPEKRGGMGDIFVKLASIHPF